MKRLTTGQVARILNVQRSVVARWIDRGVLKGGRFDECSPLRYVKPSDLYEFMVRHGFPLSKDTLVTMFR